MNTKKNGVRIIPLGGLERIGVNITAIECNDQIIVVDCGLGFPEDDMFGIDLVIPDVTYLEENKEKVLGFMITHGHEDHIGALPYVLKEMNIPIYATKLTMGLIEHKLEEHGLKDNIKRKERISRVMLKISFIVKTSCFVYPTSLRITFGIILIGSWR